MRPTAKVEKSGRLGGRSQPPARRINRYAGMLVILAIAAAILSLPFFYQSIFGLKVDGGAGTELKSFEFDDQRGNHHSTNEFRGSVVVMMFFYPRHGAGVVIGPTTPVYFTNETQHQLDVFASLVENYSSSRTMVDKSWKGDREVNFVTMIVPRVCCTRRDLSTYFVNSVYNNYDLSRITWYVSADRTYSAFNSCGSYIKNDTIDLSEIVRTGVMENPLRDDPILVLADRDFKLRFVLDGFTDASQLSARIDALATKDPATLPDGYVPPSVNVLALYAMMVFFGSVSLLMPCCLGVAIASVSSVLSIQKEAGPGMRRKDAALVGFAFSLGMGLVFFAIGMAVALVGLFLQGDFFLAGTAAALIVLGLMAFGVHRGLVNRYWVWRMKKNPPSVPIRLEGGACPHCDERTTPGVEGHKHKTRPGKKRARNAGLVALGAGGMFGVVGIPCAAVFVLPAIAIVASQSVPMLVGGAFLFAFGFARGVLTVPLAVGADAVAKSKGRLATFIVKHRKHLNWTFGITLFAFAAYTLVRLAQY